MKHLKISNASYRAMKVIVSIRLLIIGIQSNALVLEFTWALKALPQKPSCSLSCTHWFMAHAGIALLVMTLNGQLHGGIAIHLIITVLAHF